MALKVHLLIIDPQRDFMDEPDAALPVPGATQDMRNIAKMIRRVGRKLEDIHVTMDSHHTIDVGHPAMWRNQAGQAPAPFTQISADDLRNGIWKPRNPAFLADFIAYAEKLEKGGKYPLMVWPQHCVIGSTGWSIQPDLFAALSDWENEQFATVDIVTKGSNYRREHYGALMAEVEDTNDPGTLPNTKLLQILQSADIIGVGGEAWSHCVKETVSQIAGHIGRQHLKKFHLFTDGMSSVPAIPGVVDFPKIAKDWSQQMHQEHGMTLCKTTEFLA